MRLASSNLVRNSIDTSANADWYIVTAAVAIIATSFFTLVVVCAFRCYRNRYATWWNASNITSTASSERIQPSSTRSHGVIVAPLFIRPSVEYSSPQYDSASSSNTGTSDTVARGVENNSSKGNFVPETRSVITEDRSEANCRCINDVSEAAGKHIMASSDLTLDAFPTSTIVISTANSMAGSISSAGTRSKTTGKKFGGLNEKSVSEMNNNEKIFDNIESFRNPAVSDVDVPIWNDRVDSSKATPTIQFTLTYEHSRMALILSILDIRNVSAIYSSTSGMSNSTGLPKPKGAATDGISRRLGRLHPYVHLSLSLSDGRQLKAKTGVLRANLSCPSLPKIVFSETFAFCGIDFIHLVGGAYLQLALLAVDRFSHDTVIGDTVLSFDEPALVGWRVKHNHIEACDSPECSYTSERQSVGNVLVENWTGTGGPETLKISRSLMLEWNKTGHSLGKLRNPKPSCAYSVGYGGWAPDDWIRLQQQHKPCGELLVSVGIQPGAVDRLSIAVLKARKLTSIADRALQIKPNIDMYVKLYILRDGRRASRKESRVVRGCCSTQTVVFNEAFYFDLPTSPYNHEDGPETTSTSRRLAQLADTLVEVQLLLDCKRSSKEDVSLGYLVIRPFAGPSSSSSSHEVLRSEQKTSGLADVGLGTSPHQQRIGLQTMVNILGHERQVAVWYKLYH